MANTEKAPEQAPKKPEKSPALDLASAMESIANAKPEAKKTETGAEKKPELKYSDKVLGYPNETAEITDINSADYKKILALLKAKMKNVIKGRAPRHGDIVSGDVDNHVCTLLIDENSSPKEKIFRANAENLKANKGGAVEKSEIPADRIVQYSKGYPEIKNAPRDVVKRALDQFKSQRGREMAHEETATAFDSKDYEYVILRDDYKKPSPYRVFKSKEPVPA